MLSRRRCHDERGSVALMFALLAIVLFAAGAIAVDLGNAYQRQRTVQSQADLSAMSAAAKLPDQTAVVDEACRNATLNARVGQDAVSCTSSVTSLDKPPCPTGLQGRQAHVYFFSSNPYKVKVCAPGAKVTFGLAKAVPGLGDSVDVRASATVTGGSPGASAEMPYYGVAGSGCDYGPQALTDPAKGHSVTTGIPSTVATPTSGVPKQNITLTSIAPTQIPLNATSTVTITGSGLSKVTAVGFYRETSYPINKVEPTLAATSDSTGKSVTYTIPSTSPLVTQEGVWYVRVYETGSNPSQTGWSKATLVLRVGDPVVTCDSLANAGNFGSLKLPRTDSSNSTANGWLPNNVAVGLQPPLSLAVHTQAASPWTCVDGGNGVVYSSVTGSPTLKPRTNCVATDTGLTATATTAGLITGTTLYPGRLTASPTSTGVADGRSCAPNKSGSSRSVLSKTINNDILSCYVTDPSMKIQDFAKASYHGGAVLDPAIYQSPRFCYVPILNTDPTKGGSLNYSVVDMRPCFITGESADSSWSAPRFVDGTASTTQNGVTIVSGRVQTLGVVFFNRDALPNVGSGLGDYIGVGPMSVQLVD